MKRERLYWLKGYKQRAWENFLDVFAHLIFIPYLCRLETKQDAMQTMNRHIYNKGVANRANQGAGRAVQGTFDFPVSFNTLYLAGLNILLTHTHTHTHTQLTASLPTFFNLRIRARSVA